MELMMQYALINKAERPRALDVLGMAKHLASFPTADMFIDY